MKPKRATGPIDDREQPPLVLDGDADPTEVQVQDAQEREDDPQNGGEPLGAPSQPRDLARKLGHRSHFLRSGHNRRRGAVQPPSSSGPRNTARRGDRKVARLLDELDQAMVIAADGARGRHPRMVAIDSGKVKTSRLRRGRMPSSSRTKSPDSARRQQG